MYDAQARPACRSSTPLEYPGKSGPPRRAGFLPKEPSADIVEPASRTAEPADGALFRTNSSTFGTLLSSQGSSAHSNPSLSAWLEGNLQKLTGPVRASQLALPGVGESCRAAPAA